MFKLAFILTLVTSSAALAGDTYVQGYYRSNGTYVSGHHRSTPDGTVNNNYGTQGNLNTYTGRSGTKQRDPNQGQGNYNLGNGMGSSNTNSYGDND